MKKESSAGTLVCRTLREEEKGKRRLSGRRDEVQKEKKNELFSGREMDRRGKKIAWTKKAQRFALLRPRNGQGSGSTGTTTGEITERPELLRTDNKTGPKVTSAASRQRLLHPPNKLLHSMSLSRLEESSTHYTQTSAPASELYLQVYTAGDGSHVRILELLLRHFKFYQDAT